MSNLGVIRRIDELGRIVIPKELRKKLRIKNGDEIEIFIESDVIKLKKYSEIDNIKNVSINYADEFNKIIKHNIFITDRDKIISVAGPLKNKYIGKTINEFTERAIERRDVFYEKQKKEFQIVDGITENGYYTFSSIVCNGDAIGCVILISTDNPITEIDDKMISVLSSLLRNSLI